MTRVFKTTGVWLAALLSVASPAVGQQSPGGLDGGQSATGRIIGRVLDGTSARPLAGAQVFVNQGEVGTLSDLDGRYVLSGVPVGSVSVTVQIIGYTTKTVTEIQVGPDRVVSLDITTEQAALELEAIVVEATRERGSQAFLLDQRRTSSSMVEAVGAAEIARRPDSDAADVAQRLTGVTVTEGKYVFVRGLGERYSQTSLNGSSLPSPEPEREVVPLDIFPSGFLESLTTQKSYTPDLPADFSGGSVQIETKDFPDKTTVRFGFGSSVNTQSQFKNGFLTYVGGGRDWLGFDDGSRGQPSVVSDIMGDVKSGERLPNDNGQLIQIGQAFQQLGQNFAPTTGSTPLNRSFNLSVGSRSDLFDEGEIGYYVAGSYSDNYAIRTGDIERKWRVSAFDPDIPEEIRTPNVDYTFSRGTRNVAWGTVGNVTFKPNANQKVSLRSTINLSTEDEARTYIGDNREDIGGIVKADRLRFVSRLMVWNQLAGEHALFGNSRLEWRGTLSRAIRDEPLLRESVYVSDGEEFFLHPIGESGRYFWSDLQDNDVSGAFDWTFPLSVLGDGASLKFGGELRSRTRDFAARRLNWDFVGGVIEDIDAALASATIVGNARRVGEFSMEEVVEPGDLYDASDERGAGYMMVELPIGDRLEAVVGARVERYELGLFSRGDTLQQIDQVDMAPSINLIYSLRPNVKVRAAMSQTVDRPEFRELAPFQFTEATSLRQLYGNPELTPSQIRSGDLRVDWFPGAGEMISIGGFYKHLDEPIEQVFVAAASTAYSFQNADQATVMGIELDAQLALARLSPALENFAAQANYSWIDSNVEVRSGAGGFEPTNPERPLEGQAGYVVNAGINYRSWSDLEAGLFVNRFGDRLTAAGGGGIPDLYEKSRTSLDATVGFPLRGGAKAKLRATNLLDSQYRFEQEANGITQIQRLYSAGRTFSVSVSWEF